MLRFFLLAFAFFSVYLVGPSAAAEPPPGAGLAGTRHDFTTDRYTPYDNPQVTAVGLCTFCHTPHRGIKTRLLWNHTFPGTSFYTWGPEKPATSGGTPLPKISPSYNGSTAFCLSCHDGSVGTTIGDVAWFQAQAWTGSQTISRDKAGNMGYHPTAIPYPYGGVPNRYNGVTTGSRVRLNEFVPDPTISGARLFHDNNGAILAGAQPQITGIECSTCHDAHNGPQVKASKLLRVDCDSCHIK